MAARANSRSQPWIQAGNPSLERLGNHKGDIYAQLKRPEVVKPLRGRRRAQSLTEELLASAQERRREVSAPAAWALVPELQRNMTERPGFITSKNGSGERELHVDTELSSLYKSISLTSPTGVARTTASRADSPSRGRSAGLEGSVVLCAEDGGQPPLPAGLTRSVPHADDNAEQPRIANRRSLRSGDTRRNNSSLGNKKSNSTALLHTLPTPAPQPTEAYLVQASQPTQELSQPRSILLVLDLNGTLLYRVRRNRPHEIIPRPRVGEFLQYLFIKFSVMIWSSATPASVAAMCTKLFSAEQRRLLVAEWGRDRLGLTPTQYSQKVQVYKQLNTVWDSDIAASHPEHNIGGRWDQSNTILLDDSALKASAQPYNHISVPEFTGGHEPGDGRSVFSQVMSYLDAIALQRDVSSYIQKAPFRAAEEWGTRRGFR